MSSINLNYYNEKILKDSDELMKLFEKGYKKGGSDLALLIATEESYREIMQGYSDAVLEYYIDWIEFLREANNQELSFEDFL